MEKIVAACGLTCSECPAFEATRDNDYEKLKETAKKWGEMEGVVYKPEDIKCEGCFSNRLHEYCATCGVRQCTREKGHRVCSFCDEYPCNKIEKVWEATGVPVEELKSTLAKELP